MEDYEIEKKNILRSIIIIVFRFKVENLFITFQATFRIMRE